MRTTRSSSWSPPERRRACERDLDGHITGTGPAAARARQHNTADDQRDRPAGRHADGVARVMVEQSDLLRLPMAGLQQLRRVMLEHYKRNIEQLHGRRRR